MESMLIHTHNSSNSQGNINNCGVLALVSASFGPVLKLKPRIKSQKIKETMLSNQIPETSTILDQKIQKPSSSLTKRNPHQINPIELISITIGGRQSVSRPWRAIYHFQIAHSSPSLSVPFPCQFFSWTGKVHSRNVSLGSGEVVKGWRDLTGPWSPAPGDRVTESVVPWWKRSLSTAIRLCKHPDPRGYKCPI